MKKQRNLTLCRTAGVVAATVAAAHAGYCQFDMFDQMPDIPAWNQFKLDPKARVTLDFRNASVDAVLQMLSKASGIPIVKDPGLTGGLSLQSPRPQTLSSAFGLLNAALGLRNYDIEKQDNFLIVRPKQQRGGFSRFGGGSGAPDPSQFSVGDRMVLQVYPIKYANASQVARVINDVFPPPTNTPQAPTTPTPTTPQTPQQGGGGRFGGFGRRFGGGGFGGFGGRGGGAGGGALGTNTGLVRASADDYSNSVIVNASSRDQQQVADIIQQLDRQTDEPQQSRVYPLKYASATGLAPVVQNVLVSNAPRGRGGIGSQNVPIDQRFQQAARFGSAQAAFGQVVADTRTNSLVVTATPENLDLVGKVIQQLDKEVSYADSTFVFPLQNARADIIAQILNQSFSRNGGGTTNLLGNRTITNSGSVSANGNQITGGGTNRLGSTTGRAATGGAATRAASLTGAGDVTTTVGAAVAPLAAGQQGGFGGGGGGGGFFRALQGQNQQNLTATGLDSAGQVVNVRDLSGDVTAIPDVNTNSVLIVSSPQNRPILESILKQLDRIPEQVMIETLIVEANLDDTQKLGVEWSFGQGTAFGLKNTHGSGTQSFGLQADTTQPQGFRYTLSGPQYSAFLQAVQTNTKFQVLSAPRIFTSNNATAQINISQSLPYVLSQTTDTNGTILYNYSFLDVGIVLTVTPRITSNGYVTMDVTQTANDFVGYTSFNAPIVNQREAQTTVSVQDGATVALGGIIENTVNKTVNKIPLLGDIPILGNLFRENNTTKNKTELLVFLTPHVVRNAQEAEQLRMRTQSQLDTSTQKNIPAALQKEHVTVTPVTIPVAPTAATPASPSSAPTVVVPVPSPQQNPAPAAEPPAPGGQQPGQPEPGQPAPTPQPEQPAPQPEAPPPANP